MKKFRPRATAVAIADVEYRDFIQGTGGGAGINATLLPASPRRGDLVCLKKVDAGAGAMTILPAGASTIDGAASLVLPLQWDTAILLSDGTDWFTVAGIGAAVVGVGSLQQSYDVGNAIITSTASGGPVALSKGAATAAGEAVLTVTDASAIASTLGMVQFVNSGSRTSGAMLFINQTANAFTGNAFALSLGGTSTTQRALVISEGGSGANTNPLVTISNTNANRTTGDLFEIINTGTAFIGNAISVALSGNSVAQTALSIADAGAGANTQSLAEILNTNDVRTSGDLLTLSNAGDAFTGACLNVEITAASSSTGAQGVVVADNGTGVNTTALVEIAGTNDARTAAALRIGLTGAALLGNIFEMAGGDNAAVSAANEGRLRYDVASQGWQVSENAAAYSALVNATTDISGVRLQNILEYDELRQALGAIVGANTIDVENGNVVTATATGAITWTFSNPAPAGRTSAITLVLTNGGLGAQTWPGSVLWAGGVVPVLAAAGIDVLTFFTEDGGTTWYGSHAIADAQ